MKQYIIEFGFRREQRFSVIELFRSMYDGMELCEAKSLASKWYSPVDPKITGRKNIKLNEKQFLIFAEFMLTLPGYNNDVYAKIVRTYNNDSDNLTFDFTQ